MHPTRSRTGLVAGALLTVLSVGVTACSDDEDGADDTAEDTATTGDTPVTDDDGAGASGEAGPLAEGTTLEDLEDVTVTDGFCQGTLDLTAAFGAAPEDPAEAGAFVEAELVPVVESMADGLEGGLAPVVASFESIVRDAAESGEIDSLFGPDAAAARAVMGEAAHTACGFNAVDVTATDYSFGDLGSQTLTAGPTSFALDNQGDEEHEIVIFKAAEGVTATAQELLADDPEALFGQAEFTGVAFGGPGTRTFAGVELEQGATYYFICSIPVGGAEDAPPHFAAGMEATVTVG